MENDVKQPEERLLAEFDGTSDAEWLNDDVVNVQKLELMNSKKFEFNQVTFHIQGSVFSNFYY
jgi:hypothetical protein